MSTKRTKPERRTKVAATESHARDIVSKLSSTNQEKLLDIAREAVKVEKQARLPEVLLRLEDCNVEQQAVRAESLRLGLHQLIVLSLQQDFFNVIGESETAVRLCRLLCKLSLGFTRHDESDQAASLERILQDSVNGMLLVCRRIQAKHSRTLSALPEIRNKYLEQQRAIYQSQEEMNVVYGWLLPITLSSHWLHELLLEADASSVQLTLSFIANLTRLVPTLSQLVASNALEAIMDELAYKLSVTNDTAVAAASARCLLAMVEQDDTLAQLLRNRYNGFGVLLNRFRPPVPLDIQRLRGFLRAQSLVEARMAGVVWAALRIQAWWRAHRERRQLDRAATAITRFQRKYRVRQAERQHRRQQLEEAARLESDLCVRRARHRREGNQRRYQLLENVSPADIAEFLSSERHQAAVTVQRFWRGYSARCNIEERARVVAKTRAATVIQQAFRRWRDELQLRKRVHGDLALLHTSTSTRGRRRSPAKFALSDAQRMEYQRIADERTSERTHPEGGANLFRLAQQKLWEHDGGRATEELRRHRGEAMVARIQLDYDLLLRGKSLCDVEYSDVAALTSAQPDIVRRARREHDDELRRASAPWWRRLGLQDARSVLDMKTSVVQDHV